MRILNSRFGSVTVLAIATAPAAPSMSRVEVQEELTRVVQRLTSRVAQEDALREHLRGRGVAVADRYTPETIWLQLRADALRAALAELQRGGDAFAADVAHELAEVEPC